MYWMKVNLGEPQWGKITFEGIVKAVTKYERPKTFLRKRLHFCWASLFIFGCSYFVKALVFILEAVETGEGALCIEMGRICGKVM